MNEHIGKFARECGAWNQIYGNRMFMIDEHFDIEKFAELIVRECLETMGTNISGTFNSDWDFDTQVKYVKKHFGVEE
jgi:hypothetical protein